MIIVSTVVVPHDITMALSCSCPSIREAESKKSRDMVGDRRKGRIFLNTMGVINKC